jgi:hypothetical protein
VDGFLILRNTWKLYCTHFSLSPPWLQQILFWKLRVCFSEFVHAFACGGGVFNRTAQNVIAAMYDKNSFSCIYLERTYEGECFTSTVEERNKLSKYQITVVRAESLKLYRGRCNGS